MFGIFQFFNFFVCPYYIPIPATIHRTLSAYTLKIVDVLCCFKYISHIFTLSGIFSKNNILIIAPNCRNFNLYQKERRSVRVQQKPPCITERFCLNNREVYMKTFVVLRRSVYRAAVAVLPAPVMLIVLVGTIFFKPKPIG